MGIRSYAYNTYYTSSSSGQKRGRRRKMRMPLWEIRPWKEAYHQVRRCQRCLRDRSSTQLIHDTMKLWARWLLTLLGITCLVLWLRSSLNRENEEDETREAPWKRSPLWVEDRKPHINPHSFPYIINEPDLCRKGVRQGCLRCSCCSLNKLVQVKQVTVGTVHYQQLRRYILQTCYFMGVY